MRPVNEQSRKRKTSKKVVDFGRKLGCSDEHKISESGDGRVRSSYGYGHHSLLDMNMTFCGRALNGESVHLFRQTRVGEKVFFSVLSCIKDKTQFLSVRGPGGGGGEE